MKKNRSVHYFDPMWHLSKAFTLCGEVAKGLTFSKGKFKYALLRKASHNKNSVTCTECKKRLNLI